MFSKDRVMLYAPPPLYKWRGHKNSVDPDLLASSGSALFASLNNLQGQIIQYSIEISTCDPLKYKKYCISNMYGISHQNEMV